MYGHCPHRNYKRACIYAGNVGFVGNTGNVHVGKVGNNN